MLAEEYQKMKPDTFSGAVSRYENFRGLFEGGIHVQLKKMEG